MPSLFTDHTPETVCPTCTEETDAPIAAGADVRCPKCAWKS